MQTPIQNNQPDMMSTINGVIQQILGSNDPSASFQQFVSNNPEAKIALDIANQYGNGDFKTGFMNYAAASGKQAIAQQILQMMGLA